MPILSAEPELYPPDLWVGPARPLAVDPEEGPRWWCLHAKPRQEKATARHLLAKQIAFYLPLVVQESRTPGGRKIRSNLPLFPGYLFLLCDVRDRLKAFQADTLVHCLEVADQVGLDRDLYQVHRMLSSGLAVVPEPSHPVGADVRITTGPLVGLVGRVVRRGGHDRFAAIVHFLGRGAVVDLADWQVERLPSSSPGPVAKIPHERSERGYASV